MIRAKIPTHRTTEGRWKAGTSSIHIDQVRPIALSPVRQEDMLADLVETIMGDALLSLDKNGRRGTSEPIQWEITVDGLPYCYRCVEPMQGTSGPPDASAAAHPSEWKCLQCGTVIQFHP